MKRHSKSRRGCLQCKARHVRVCIVQCLPILRLHPILRKVLTCGKCSEERPACAACVRRRTRCEYGPLLVSFDKRSTTDTHSDQAVSSISLQQASLDSPEHTPGSELSNIERRLLSLYLERAKPAAGKDDIWATEVPARAHQVRLQKAITHAHPNMHMLL